ncbi:MAG: hypothetical protein NVSMB38_05860 [Ktedonobacteraceae bacterium]
MADVDPNQILPLNTAVQSYLLNEQYKDATNLNARIQLHERFSTNPYDWQRWVFDQIKTGPKSHMLEIGCGPARLWLNNFDRIPQGWHITLSDFSLGMLQEAQHNLRAVRHNFTFQRFDVQSIPFKDKSFDVVIANHMLYHVPDLNKALSEIRRVLTPKGRFYAATNGLNHLDEIGELIRRVEPSYWMGKVPRDAFNLEHGAEDLSRWFSHVTVSIVDDGLVVTETEPLIAFILSMPVQSFMTDEKLQTLRESIDREIKANGAIRITKSTGIFEASLL